MQGVRSVWIALSLYTSCHRSNIVHVICCSQCSSYQSRFNFNWQKINLTAALQAVLTADWITLSTIQQAVIRDGISTPYNKLLYGMVLSQHTTSCYMEWYYHNIQQAIIWDRISTTYNKLLYGMVLPQHTTSCYMGWYELAYHKTSYYSNPHKVVLAHHITSRYSSPHDMVLVWWWRHVRYFLIYFLIERWIRCS